MINILIHVWLNDFDLTTCP